MSTRNRSRKAEQVQSKTSNELWMWYCKNPACNAHAHGFTTEAIAESRGQRDHTNRQPRKSRRDHEISTSSYMPEAMPQAQAA